MWDIPGITLPATQPNVRHAWHIFTILLDGDISRDACLAHLRSQNIGANVHYIPIYRHSYYQKTLPVDFSSYPVTESVFNRIITLPLYPDLKDEEMDYVVSTVSKFMAMNQS
jgi:dTDP-4-amino-4,6-dideoxygalactose transaminase